MYAGVSGSIPGRVEIFNKKIIPAVRRCGGVEPHSLVSVPNIPGLNTKSYDVKGYILLIATRPLDGDVKPGIPLGAFEKNKLMPEPGFSFTLPHSYITLQYYTYTDPRHLLTYSYTTHCNVASRSGAEI